MVKSPGPQYTILVSVRTTFICVNLRRTQINTAMELSIGTDLYRNCCCEGGYLAHFICVTLFTLITDLRSRSLDVYLPWSLSCGNIHYRLSVIELRRSRAVQQLLSSRHSVQRCSAVSRRAAVLAQSGNSARQTVPTRQPVQ